MKVRKMVRRRLFSVLMAITLVFSMTPAVVFGADGNTMTSSVSQFSDMPDNWSTQALQNAVANGLLSGADGRIMPDQNLTRAQMATVITRAFGSTVKGDLSGFTDVKPADWFSDSLAKAYQMGVIKGSGSLMNPNSAITRQEVFVILARAFKLQPAEKISKTFNDVNLIADWAKGEAYAFVNAGYIQGSNGKLNPKNLITRAEFAQIFDNILKQYINTAGEVTQVSAGNVMINVPGVTLKNLKVNGDLIIGDGVGDGEATLDSVTVTGRLVIRGGGENSIIIKGTSSVSNVVVARVDGVVSVKVQGDADVEVIYIDDGSDDVNVEGIFGNIEIAAPEIVVKAVGATITNLNVAGEGSKIVVDSASKVSSVTIQAPNTQISGTGTVTKVEAQAGSTGAKIETPNTQISVGAGVSGVTGGGNSQIQPGTTVNNTSDGKSVMNPTAPLPSGGGNSHHDDSTPAVGIADINVTNDTTVKFNCDVAGATIEWNGAQLSGATVVGANTITVSPAAFGSVNTLEISKSGYTTYSNAAVVRELVSSGSEFAAAMATTAASIKLGADLTLTTSTMAITRAVTINGNGHSVNKTVVVTADNVTIKNLKGTVTTKTQHGISGIGSNTAFYINAKGVVLDGVTVDGSNYPATAPSIGIIGYDASEFTVKNSSLSNLLTGIFPHIGYTLKHPNKFTADGNTFENVTAGIGGTQYTTVTITGNTFKSVKPGGEGIGLGEGASVVGSTAPETAVSWLEAKNTFNFTANSEDKVRDYRLISTTEVKDATHITLTSLYNDLTFKIGTDNYTITPAASGNTTYPYRYDIELSAGKALNFGRNTVTAVQPGVLQSSIVAYYDLAKFIKNSKDKDVIELQAGTYFLSEQLNIEKAITLRGIGSVTIKASNPSWSTTDNSKKHLITVYAGTSSSAVHLENITFDADGISCGLHAYGNAYCKLKDVTIKNSRNAALIVNGSTVEADNLNTSNNVWGAVNVDPGSGVKTPSIFTLTGSGIQQEFKQIWSDGANVTGSAVVLVNAPSSYKEYRFKAKPTETDTMWIKDLKNAAVLDNWIYLNIQEAITAATTEGSIVVISPGTYDITTALSINKKITVKGMDGYRENTILKGGRTIGSTVNLSDGAALKNLTVTRDNSGDWSTNANNSLVAFGGTSANTTLENCIVTHGRNGVYLNNSYGSGKAIIINNKIFDNRTGINFCNNCNNMEITGNEITDNWTLGMVHYTSVASDLSTITLKDNIIKGNWVGQIFIKSSNPWDPQTALVTGNLKLDDNDFGGTSAGGIQTITVAEKYNYAHAEPGYNGQQPASVGGTAARPEWTPPTVRIYGYSTAGIEGAGIQQQKYTDTPSGSVNVASESDLRSALVDDTVTTINLTADILINSMLMVNNPVTINGAGHTITVVKDLGIDNSSKHAIDIYANDVTLKNITIDSNGKAFGAQAYEAGNVYLNDVTLLNSTGAGFTVNGSTVTANNLNTSSNSWGGVNVDPGKDVAEASKFTLTGNGTLAEAIKIWSDGDHVSDSATVTVDAAGYTQNVSPKKGYYWTKDVISAVSITSLIAPITGATPITYEDLTTSDTAYTINSLTWNLGGAETFEAGKAYTATIVLTAKDAYKFPSAGITPTVNTGTADPGTTSGGDVKGNQLTFTVKFDQTI